MPTVWFADRERLILEWNFRGRILPEFLVSLLLVGNTLTVSGQGIFLEKIRSLQQIPGIPAKIFINFPGSAIARKPYP
jgi:hypothetical protein